MKKLTHTEKIALAAFVLNVVIFSVCFLIFYDIRKTSNTISALENELNQGSEKQSLYFSVNDIISETKAEREAIDSFFVGKEGTVGFIDLIEDQGRLSDATTTIISVKTEDDDIASSTVEVLSLGVEAGASWSNLFHFLSLLENLPYTITYQDVSIRKEEDSVNYWEAHFTLRVLKLKK